MYKSDVYYNVSVVTLILTRITIQKKRVKLELNHKNINQKKERYKYIKTQLFIPHCTALCWKGCHWFSLIKAITNGCNKPGTTVVPRRLKCGPKHLRRSWWLEEFMATFLRWTQKQGDLLWLYKIHHCDKCCGSRKKKNNNKMFEKLLHLLCYVRNECIAWNMKPCFKYLSSAGRCLSLHVFWPDKPREDWNVCTTKIWPW